MSAARGGAPRAQCSFFEFNGKTIMYRRYASLFFICGTDGQEVSLATEQLSGTRRIRVTDVRTCGAVGSSAAGIREWGEASAACAARCSHRAPPGTAIPRPQNNLAILELIHTLVETLDRYFENVVRVRSATAAPRPPTSRPCRAVWSPG